MHETILVTKSSMPPIEEYIEKMKVIWENHWLTNRGIYHKEFEKKLLNYLNVHNISLFTNGHMALELTIQAMNLTSDYNSFYLCFNNSSNSKEWINTCV